MCNYVQFAGCIIKTSFCFHLWVTIKSFLANYCKKFSCCYFLESCWFCHSPFCVQILLASVGCFVYWWESFYVIWDEHFNFVHFFCRRRNSSKFMCVGDDGIRHKMKNFQMISHMWNMWKKFRQKLSLDFLFIDDKI